MDWASLSYNIYKFVWDKQFLSLLLSTIILFLTTFIAWYFYHKQLAKRDLFEIPVILGTGSPWVNFVNRLVYFLKYLLIFPVYSFVWFLIFSFMLFLMARTQTLESIFYFAIVVVAATRISAYVNRKLAEDMAKLLPWTLVFIFLTDPQSVTVRTIESSISSFLEYIPHVAKYLLFIILVEWFLRVGHWVLKPSGKQAAQP